MNFCSKIVVGYHDSDPKNDNPVRFQVLILIFDRALSLTDNDRWTCGQYPVVAAAVIEVIHRRVHSSPLHKKSIIKKNKLTA